MAAGGASGGGSALTGGVLMGLLAAGICVLSSWAFVRFVRPEKFFLRRVPGRANHVHPLHVLAVFLIHFVSMPLVALAVIRLTGAAAQWPEDVPMTASIPAMIFAQLVLGGGSLTVAAMTFRHGLRRGLGLSARHALADGVRGIVGYLAVLPLCFAALQVTTSLVPPDWVQLHPLLPFVKAPEASTAWVLLVFFSAGMLAPVTEELFYRGLIQSMLRRYALKPWPAILVTSIMFALSHKPHYQDMPALFILSLALGYNYERTGRLVAPMVLHGAFNLAALWMTLSG